MGLPRPGNRHVPSPLLPAAVEPAPEAQEYLISAVRRWGFSGCAVHRILRVALTVADMGGHERVEQPDTEESCTQRAGA